MKNYSFTETEELELVETLENVEAEMALVLYNDDFNTFEFVIDSLIKVCRHEVIQAEQCTHLVHFTGKCVVKNGTFKVLRPMCEALLERGLTAAIED